MNDDYTPTTDQVRLEYLRSAQSLARVAAPESDPEAEAEFDRWLADHDREVLASARVAAQFDPWLPNDGEFEYTSTSDCEGSSERFFRRRPRYFGDYHPWEPTTADAHATAVAQQSAEVGS